MVALASALEPLRFLSASWVMASSPFRGRKENWSCRYLDRRVKARICLLIVLVDIQELAEQLVVDSSVVRVGVIGLAALDALRDVVKGKVSQGDQANKRRPANVRQPGVPHLPDPSIQDIRMNLAPQARLGAPANEVDRIKSLLHETFHVPVHPLRIVGDALKGRSDQVRPRRGQR